MTCITIASWMSAVVGLIITISSLWYIKNHFDGITDAEMWMIPISCLGATFGIAIFAICVSPYIPDITLPCIQIIP